MTRDFHDHPEWQALYAGLIEDPLNVTRRLVIADWLDDFGTEDASRRAQVIRICNQPEWRAAVDADVRPPGELVAELLAALGPDKNGDAPIPSAIEGRNATTAEWYFRETGERGNPFAIGVQPMASDKLTRTGFFGELEGGYWEASNAGGGRVLSYDPFIGIASRPAGWIRRENLSQFVFETGFGDQFAPRGYAARPRVQWQLRPLTGRRYDFVDLGTGRRTGVVEWRYHSRFCAEVDLSRAMIDRARELAGMPPLAWPPLPPDEPVAMYGPSTLRASYEALAALGLPEPRPDW